MVKVPVKVHRLTFINTRNNNRKNGGGGGSRTYSGIYSHKGLQGFTECLLNIWCSVCIQMSHSGTKPYVSLIPSFILSISNLSFFISAGFASFAPEIR